MRRSLAIEISQSRWVIVRAPILMTRWSIEKYLLSKKKWIEKHLEKQKEKWLQKVYTQEEQRKMQKELKIYLEKRVHELWQDKNIPPYTSLKVTLSERRWWSCSQKNSLCFSYRLAEYMDTNSQFIEAIIIHELAHIVHKNHQKSFWNLVYSWMPEYKKTMKLRHQS